MSIMFASDFFDEKPLLQEEDQSCTGDDMESEEKYQPYLAEQPEHHHSDTPKAAAAATTTQPNPRGDDYEHSATPHSLSHSIEPSSSMTTQQAYCNSSAGHLLGTYDYKQESPHHHGAHQHGHHFDHYHQSMQPQNQLKSPAVSKPPPQQPGHRPKEDKDDGGYTDLDVLCEKGGRANQHMGNRVFLRLVQLNKEVYRKLIKKQDKDFLIQSIVLAIQQNGGRFRQRSSPSSAIWQTVSWERCYQKARQALREPDRKAHKAAVVANEAAAAKQAMNKQQERKPAAASPDTRKLTRKPHSEAIRQSSANEAGFRSTNRVIASIPVVLGTSSRPSRTMRHDLLEDFSYNHNRPSSSQNHNRLDSFSHTHLQTIRYDNEPSQDRSILLSANRRSTESSPPSMSLTSSAHDPLGVGEASHPTNATASSLQPLPLYHHDETTEAVQPLLLETLLERQDSLPLSHLLDVVGDHKRKEEVRSDPKNPW